MKYEDWYRQFVNTSIAGLKETVKNSRMKMEYKASEAMVLTMERCIFPEQLKAKDYLLYQFIEELGV